MPEAAGVKLDAAQQQQILQYLTAGGHVVAEGKQPWLTQLGFVWQGRRIALSAVTDDLYPTCR